jgi:hypothetical protein
MANKPLVIAGFFTGGALAIRGGAKAARNSAIGCACLLAVIEGVGIGFQRMMAENTRLDVCFTNPSSLCPANPIPDTTTTCTTAIRIWWHWLSCNRTLILLRKNPTSSCRTSQMAYQTPTLLFLSFAKRGTDCCILFGLYAGIFFPCCIAGTVYM